MTPLNDIEMVGQRLWHLANAFELTGNSEMAFSLREMSGSIYDGVKAARNAVSDHIHAEFKQAQESSTSVLKAALAGVKLAETSEQKTS
jgi:hypothetical protein